MQTNTTPAFERIGWDRLDIGAAAQARIEKAFAAAGVPVEALDVADYKARFDEWRNLAEYEGAYRLYPGDMAHCLAEKSLEHFLSVVIAEPREGMTAVDIGSCKSVVPGILRRVYGVRCLEQDLSYPSGVEGDRVGSSADDIPLEDASVDFMTLHCTFEHFEGGADIGFVSECARLLRPNGRVVILPLYLNATHCNVTGVTDPAARAGIGWDADADHYCEIPEWQDRFGRHYSVRAVLDRVIAPAMEAGLKARVVKVVNWEAVDKNLWLRWILVLEQGENARPRSRRADPRLQELKRLREEVATLGGRMEALEAAAEARMHERNLLEAQLAESRRQFGLVESDRLARGEVIERQGRRSSELESLVHLTEQNRDWHKAEAERLAAQALEREAATSRALEDLRRQIEVLRRELAERDDAIGRTASRLWFRLGRRMKLL